MLPAQADIFDDYGDVQDDFDFRGEVGMYTNRLFRGQNLYDGPSIQPRIRAQANTEPYALYLEAFGHLSAGDDGDSGDAPLAHGEESYSELNYDLGGLITFDSVTLHIGHRWYSYSKRTARLDNTGEYFGKIQLDAPAHPHFEYDLDWEHYRGGYGELGVEEPFPVAIPRTKTSVSPFLTVSFSNGLANGPHPIYAEDGLVSLDFGVRGELYFTENFYIEPELQYTHPFDDASDATTTFGIRVGGTIGLR
ncbi:MAG: hypothetical protein U0136_04125 [Bdellovibrionota bacterium]